MYYTAETVYTKLSPMYYIEGYYTEGTLLHSKNSLYKTVPPCIILRGHFCMAKTGYAKLSPMYYTEGTLLHSKNSLFKTVPLYYMEEYYIEGTFLHSRNSLYKTVPRLLY